MNEDTKHKFLLAILIILIIVLLGLVGLIYRQIKSARDVAAREDGLVSSSATIAPTDNISVSYDLGSPSSANTEILDGVKDVANRFMQAKENRSLEEAKPYMTEDLFKSTAQEEFAGTSSPSMDRFEVKSAQAVKTPNTYEVDVVSYWKLNGEDAETVNYSLIVIKQDENYLVSKF